MKKQFMHEQLPINEQSPVIVRSYDYNRFTFPWHFHSEYEIIYVKEGFGNYFVADRTGTFQNGDILFLGSNLPHYMKSAREYDNESNNLRIKGVVIQFHKEFMSYAISNYLDLKPIKRLLEESSRGILFPSANNKEIISQIDNLSHLRGINRLINLLSLFNSMAKHPNRDFLGSSQFNNALSTFTDNRLERILSYINYHYTEEIELADIAARIPMNVSAFCRYFKEKSGKNFTDYILELRIGYACKLLSNKQMNISEIAISSGFNTITHFNRVFKRKTGFTPTTYQKLFLQD